jgi:alanine racemase
VEEALVLRAAGIKQRIVLMEGFFTAEELLVISQQNLEIVIHNHEQLKALQQHTSIEPLTVWLKINTGMNRLGFLPQDAKEVWQVLKDCKAVKQIRLMTHFADADDLSKPSMLRQIDCFNEVTAHMSGERSLANSAAILGWPAAHADWVRPGIMLYGVSPFSEKTGEQHGLMPVMTLRSEIIAIQALRKGDAVGYGSTWIAPQDMRIGVVAIGYGDGYPRNAKNGTPVLLNNHVVSLVGRVSMDMLTIDLHTQPKAKVGDAVTLWGKNLPVETISKTREPVFSFVTFVSFPGTARQGRCVIEMVFPLITVDPKNQEVCL